MLKYLLPAAGACYHLSEDGKLPLCGARIRVWVVTDKEPLDDWDYRSCKRCEKKAKKATGLKD